MTRIFTDDIHKLAKETGLSFDEARSLLLRANGDYRKALRMHQEAFTVYVEPEAVEDAPVQTAARALHALRCAALSVRRVMKSARFRRSAAAVLLLLTIFGAPKISLCSLLILLLIRLAAPRSFAGAAA